MQMGKSAAVRTRKKQSKRKETLGRRREYATLCATADLFPEIRVDPGDAPPPLVAAVRAAVRRVRVEHAERLLPPQRDFYRAARRCGFGPAQAGLHVAAEKVGVRGTFAFSVCLMNLGDALLASLPSGLLERYIPYHCIDLTFGYPTPNSILASFRALLTARTPGGTAYHSRRRPTVAVGDRRGIVAFTLHAIERICTRTVHDWRSFGGSGDVFAYLENCIYYEGIVAGDGQPLFAIYNSCRPGFAGFGIAEAVLGDLDPARSYYYRVGYCPVAFTGPFALAKTLLSPGMRGTPEHAALARSGMPAAERRRLSRGEGGLTFRDLVLGEDYSALRWFHEHGVPQVVAMDREVFRYGAA
jgi:hypothetical protein